MVDLYKKYYLESEKIKQLLQSGIIIFDTSALLDLYYYSETTRNEIFEKVFAYLQDRLWIPAQVYYEFLKNRDIVSEKPINTYKNLLVKNKDNKDSGYVESILKLSESIEKNILKDLNGIFKTLQEQTQKVDKHPYFSPEVYKDYRDKLLEFESNVEDFRGATEQFKLSYEENIDKRIQELENNTEDGVHDVIEKRFQIGMEYDYCKMIELAKEGAFRYEELIPPGYKDADKKIGLQKYGDLYAWKQILDYIKKKKTDAIFVINDVKEDWFDSDKKTPRFELLKEFNSETQKSIWLMPMTEFLYQINHLLDTQLEETTIVDVESVIERRIIPVFEEDDILDEIQSVFSNVLNESIYLIEGIIINREVRVFDRPYLFAGEDEDGNKYRIIASVISGGTYAKTLHAMTNALEIKKFYEVNGEKYKYYNFIILKNKGLIEKFDEHLLKKKVRNSYKEKKMKTVVSYYDERLHVIKTNFTAG